jgi:hypothetical protein
VNTTHRNSPAFPCDWDYINSNREAANGMSLRDYFAGQAIVGMLAAANTRRDVTNAELATVAYSIADAMLEARDA